MKLRDVLNNLESIKDIARSYEEDMWHEEHAILEGVFRDIADEIELVIGELEGVMDKLGSCESEISSIMY